MSRILHVLALIALIFAPATMHEARAAPSAEQRHGASADGHCGGQQAPDDGDQARGADCALACSAMPGAGAAIAATTPIRAGYAPSTPFFFAGTAPGSDPPPPRFS